MVTDVHTAAQVESTKEAASSSPYQGLHPGRSLPPLQQQLVPADKLLVDADRRGASPGSDYSAHSARRDSPTSSVSSLHSLSGTGSLVSAVLKPSAPSLTPSLANYYNESLIEHVTGWQADHAERQDLPECDSEDAFERQEVIEQCALKEIHLDFDEYVHIDSDGATCPENTVESIVAEVCDEKESQVLRNQVATWSNAGRTRRAAPAAACRATPPLFYTAPGFEQCALPNQSCRHSGAVGMLAIMPSSSSSVTSAEFCT
ncbi:hypothetical protein HPB49_005606 [Dermacentor silvarum]|uniref:Uncharacterized protein n=1 Tax=Dermacentor silvarum TaxID=543639 RepID=A0ACB8DVE2_DERSI|nr:hypothetical protein HPB49_005606 [Dermacentor silvarum]